MRSWKGCSEVVSPGENGWQMTGTQGGVVTRPSLDEQGCQQVHAAALRLLGDVGCVVLDPEALALLEAHGAVAEGERVRFGEELVAEALATVPALSLIHISEPTRLGM